MGVATNSSGMGKDNHSHVLSRVIMAPETAKVYLKSDLSNSVVYIVGPNVLQNELLASFLERETGATCLVAPTIEAVAERAAGSFDPPHLYMVDCKGKKADGLLLELESDKDIMKEHFLCLFNVMIRGGIEEDAVERGVRGIFYDDTPMEYFSKGIAAIYKGELWLSRETMTKCIMKFKRQAGYVKREQSPLTQREIEIITMIASGATNDEIARDLYISSHTVKTHVYNIFKKINAPNRLQAALWAVKNL